MNRYTRFVLDGLAMAANVNLPLPQAVRALAREAPSSSLRLALEHIAQGLEAGRSLSNTLADYPWLISESDVAIIAAAEEQGRLAAVLKKMIAQRREQKRLAYVARGAFFVPIFQICWLIVVLSSLMIFVIPKFVEVFKDLTDGGQALNPVFLIVLHFSSLFEHYFGDILFGLVYLPAVVGGYIEKSGGIALATIAVLLLIGIGYPFAAIFLFRLFKAVAQRFYYLYYRLPLIGAFAREKLIVRVCGYLESALAVRLPAERALAMVAASEQVSTFGWAWQRKANIMHSGFSFKRIGLTAAGVRFRRAEESVRQGQKISDALAATRLFPPAALWLIRNGESRGQVAEAFGHAAEFYAIKLESRYRHLRDWAMPITAILVGLAVGLLIYGIFKCLTQILETIR